MRKEYNFSKGKRGPILEPDPSKVRITIRLGADIVEYFKDQVHTSTFCGSIFDILRFAFNVVLSLQIGSISRLMDNSFRQLFYRLHGQTL
jgi:hypothetical protein